MDKKILVKVWCTDDYAIKLDLETLRKNFKFFHPNIDFKVIDSAMTNEMKKNDPWLSSIWMNAATAIPFIEDYDTIVHLDADIVITGPLDELFEADEDVISVRNNNSLDLGGSCGKPNGYNPFNPQGCLHNISTIVHFPPYGRGNYISYQKYVNNGTLAVNRKEFWYDLHELNKKAAQCTPYGFSDEQCTLNQLFHWKKYKSRIIDPIGSKLSYGPSNTWGANPSYIWNSWGLMYMQDNKLMINDPKTHEPTVVKILHQTNGEAGEYFAKQAGGFKKWVKSIVNPEVGEYLESINAV
jgi:hypothetical protein